MTSTDAQDLEAMKKILWDSKVNGGKKSLWAMTAETFGMADPKSKKGDIKVQDLSVGLELLNDYVDHREKEMEEPNSLMKRVPLEEFQATKDVFLSSFLKWAEKEDSKTKEISINVSKAQRRMDAYFEWMKEHEEYFVEPLTKDSITKAAKVWDIQISHDDKGLFLWWINLGGLDKKAVKDLTPKEHLRYVVWFSHLVMFDKKAQENGAMIIEDLGYMGFFDLNSMVPTELGAKLDRLTIGILPVKMKSIYVFGAATWMHILMGLMKPFMGKKMRERMVILPNKTDMQKFCDDLVTRKNIPEGFSSLEGGTPKDAFFNSL